MIFFQFTISIFKVFTMLLVLDLQKGKRDPKNNYRGTSISAPFVSKILEKLHYCKSWASTHLD